MAKPQQPELHRSGRGATDPASAKTAAQTTVPKRARANAPGPTPEDNVPGHHPDHEQDKPVERFRTRAEALAQETRTVELGVRSLRFRARVAGPHDGEPVLLLHGFPQDSRQWTAQLAALGDAGYRAIAPDQRGYSPAARPRQVAAYSLDHLVGDVVDLAGSLGLERFHLVGHDWGAVVAWAATARHPDRVITLTAVSTPHPAALLEAVPRSWQLARSWWVGLFALPWLPETVLAAGGGFGLRQILTRSGLPPDKAADYAKAMIDGGALRPALNWYRALRPSTLRLPNIEAPTLYVWGSADAAVGRTAAERTGAHVWGPYRFEVIDGADHWIPETSPDHLNRLLLDQLAEADALAR